MVKEFLKTGEKNSKRMRQNFLPFTLLREKRAPFTARYTNIRSI